MRTDCPQCGHPLRPHAHYCGQCGSDVAHALERARRCAPPAVMAPRMPLRSAAALDAALDARTQLEIFTRLNPLMNRERLKAVTMWMAAGGGTGTIGVWCDD